MTEVQNPLFKHFSSAIEIGDAADEIVLAIGRLIRGKAPDETDRKRLAEGASLLEELASPPNSSGGRAFALGGAEGARAALVAVRSEAHRGTEVAYLAGLAESLKTALETQAIDKEALHHARRLFHRIGRLALSAANELVTEGPEFSAWLRQRQSTNS